MPAENGMGTGYSQFEESKHLRFTETEEAKITLANRFTQPQNQPGTEIPSTS